MHVTEHNTAVSVLVSLFAQEQEVEIEHQVAQQEKSCLHHLALFPRGLSAMAAELKTWEEFVATILSKKYNNVFAPSVLSQLSPAQPRDVVARPVCCAMRTMQTHMTLGSSTSQNVSDTGGR